MQYIITGSISTITNTGSGNMLVSGRVAWARPDPESKDQLDNVTLYSTSTKLRNPTQVATMTANSVRFRRKYKK